MGLLSMCSACGSDWCTNAACVRQEYKDRAIRILKRLRERNDGDRVLIKVKEIDSAIEAIESWSPQS